MENVNAIDWHFGELCAERIQPSPLSLQEPESKRALDKAERDAKRADKLLRKANVNLARAQHNLAKLELAAAKQRKARRFLPDKFPDWEDSMSESPLLSPDGYVRLDDMGQFQQVVSALQARTFAKALDLLSGLFECDKSEICLIEDRVINRRGRKISVMYFRFNFHQGFNEALKEAGNAVFDPRIKGWNLLTDEALNSELTKKLRSFFRVIIDVNRMIIFKSSFSPVFAAKTKLAFRTLPFHVQVHRNDVLSELGGIRPNDALIEDKLYINDGSRFVPYPGNEVVWTKSPFLLFRYAVSDGRPRYASYSTLGKSVEGLSYGNNSKKTSLAIARFMDSCCAQKISAFEADVGNVVKESPVGLSNLHGNFERFSACIEIIHSVVTDVGIAPLCSDYVSLLAVNYGADSEFAGIIAYVEVAQEAGQSMRLKNIASFFGYPETSYPIVFTRSALDLWAANQSSDFRSVVAHELAHWFVLESSDVFPSDDSHGVPWAICQDLLEYLFVGEFNGTAYASYHSNEFEIVEGIEYMVQHVGIPTLNSIRSGRPLLKVDIKNATLACITALREVAVY